MSDTPHAHFASSGNPTVGAFLSGVDTGNVGIGQQCQTLDAI
jgi:hypothetical protein